MNISLQQVSKRFQRHWIFRNIDYSFSAPDSYALLGDNGSGKSTLLRIIAGMQSPSQGKMEMKREGQVVPADKLYQYISFCAPGMELVEELTMREFLEFHFSFKRPVAGMRIDDIIATTGLTTSAEKPIGDYSSGMRQRVKLAQAIFSDTPILLLDEPCTNLDQHGMEQYRGWIEQYGTGRLVIVASNDTREYFFCKEQVVLADYK